jgi:carbamoyl-phosphate synthase large subunit
MKKRIRAPSVAVKEAVFPFARFPGVDVLLGPEMRSTGEVMGLDTDFALAFAKAQLGAGVELPLSGARPPVDRDGLCPGRHPRHGRQAAGGRA